MSKLRLPRRSRQTSLPPPDQPEDDEALATTDDGHGARMGFFDHLEELRYRVTRAALALIVGTVFGIIVAQPVLVYLTTPYCDAVRSNMIELANDGELNVNEGRCELVTLGPTDSVVVYFRVSLLIGAIISVPLVTYQLLMFIFPGLTRREKRLFVLSLPAITLLFLVGATFSWFVLMPPALGFLEGFQRDLFRPEWTADLYLSFVTSLIFWMGVAFETPLVFFVLGLLGLVSTRPLLTNRRIAIIAAAIAAAFITPTIDPVNMGLVMGPLLVLYMLSIVLVFVARRIARIDSTVG